MKNIKLKEGPGAGYFVTLKNIDLQKPSIGVGEIKGTLKRIPAYIRAKVEFDGEWEGYDWGGEESCKGYVDFTFEVDLTDIDKYLGKHDTEYVTSLVLSFMKENHIDELELIEYMVKKGFLDDSWDIEHLTINTLMEELSDRIVFLYEVLEDLKEKYAHMFIEKLLISLIEDNGLVLEGVKTLVGAGYSHTSFSDSYIIDFSDERRNTIDDFYINGFPYLEVIPLSLLIESDELASAINYSYDERYEDFDEKAKENRKSIKEAKLTESIEDKVLKGFLAGVLFTGVDENDEPLENNFSIKDIDKDSFRKATKIVKEFLMSLPSEPDDILSMQDETEENLGIDLWMTMTGQGVTFLDGNWGIYDKELYDTAKKVLKKIYVEGATSYGDSVEIY